MKTAADTLKRVHLELGGKAPFIVFEDADVEALAEAAMVGACFNTGQDCTAATRLYVESDRFDETVDAVVESFKGITIGDPWDEDTFMGPLISATQRERVAGSSTGPARTGAKVVLGGGVPEGLDRGYYYSPTVIVDADQKSEIVQQEVFGPVLVVLPFDGEEQARPPRQRRPLRARGLGVDQGHRPGDAHGLGPRVRDGVGQRPPAVWPRRHPTVGSSSPVSARTCRWSRSTTTPSPST